MDKTTQIVQDFYQMYPFSNVAINEVSIRNSWFLHFEHLYYQTFRRYKSGKDSVMLDAGCGCGDTTALMAIHNPDATITAIDISQQSLETAQKLTDKHAIKNVTFLKKDINSLSERSKYDLIVSSGVIHHMSDPVKGLQQLTSCLKDDGVMLLFLYSSYGRREISLLQQALDILERDRSNYKDRAALAHAILSDLPLQNRIAQFYRHPAMAVNLTGANFVDTYVHPNETWYDINTLFDLLGSADLEFAGFLDQHLWDPISLIKNEAILNRIESLSLQDKLHFMELLSADKLGYTFLTRRKGMQLPTRPLCDHELLSMRPMLNPALQRVDEKTLALGETTLNLMLGPINLMPEFTGMKTIKEIIDKINAAQKDHSLFFQMIYSLENNGVIFLV